MKPKLLTGEIQEGESKNAIIACNDYLRMGPGRSLGKLHNRYQAATKPLPPTTRLMTIKNWSRRFGWVDRAAAYDATWEERKNKERFKVFNDELALDYERVRKLNRLGQFLEEQLFEQNQAGGYPNLWVHDVKIVGRGDDAEVVDIERFNASIIREFRETLNDLASETGGRVKRQDITSGGEMLKAPSVIEIVRPESKDD